MRINGIRRLNGIPPQNIIHLIKMDEFCREVEIRRILKINYILELKILISKGILKQV